jgi:hypothetical protein
LPHCSARHQAPRRKIAAAIAAIVAIRAVTTEAVTATDQIPAARAAIWTQILVQKIRSILTVVAIEDVTVVATAEMIAAGTEIPAFCIQRLKP